MNKKHLIKKNIRNFFHKIGETRDNNLGKEHSWIINFSISIISVLLATFIKFKLDPFIDLTEAPFLIFFASIVVSSWFGGFKAGLIATILSAIVVDYFFLSSSQTLLFNSKHNFLDAVFISLGVLISWLNSELLFTMRKTRDLSMVLKKERDVLEVIMENTEAGLVYLDSQFNFLRVNSAYAKNCKMSKKELIGKNHFGLFPNEENEEIFKKVRDTGVAIEFRAKPFMYKYQPWRGITYWDWTLVPIKSHGGKVKELVFSVMDVTEQKLAEDALFELNKKISNVLESITDAFFALDDKWHFTYLNTQTEEVFRKKRQELLGKNIWKVFPKANTSTFYRKSHEAIKMHKSFEFEQFYAPLKKWFDIRIYPAKEGLSVYWHDVTERRELDDRKNEFISIASHELKTPLTTIKAYAQIIKNRLEKFGEKESIIFLSKMETQIKRLTRLVEDLLDVSRIESGILNMIKEPLNLDKLVADTIDDLQKISYTHKILKEGKIQGKVLADKVNIGRVLINIISNAIKYSPNSDKVIVKVSEEKGTAIISVRDFGIGILKQDQKRIFERFFRVKEKQGKFSGFGLGLYISSRIIDQHKGKIWVKSEKGKGSTFYFLLPLIINKN